jgi:hypothetical protein
VVAAQILDQTQPASTFHTEADMTRITTRPYSLRESEMLRKTACTRYWRVCMLRVAYFSETELSTELSAMLPPSGLLHRKSGDFSGRRDRRT